MAVTITEYSVKASKLAKEVKNDDRSVKQAVGFILPEEEGEEEYEDDDE